MENNEPKNEDNLLDSLAAETEHKEPSTFTNKSWNFEEVDEDPEAASENADEPGKKDKHDQIANNLKKPKVSDEEKRISAETATAALESFLEMLCVPLINRKFNKKLTIEEMDKGEANEYKAIETLTPGDQAIQQKFNAIMKKRDAKIKNIAFDTKETNRTEKIFYNYFKIKDIAMPPEWLLYVGLGNTIADRVIEVVTD